jgi:hypothetical protein
VNGVPPSLQSDVAQCCGADTLLASFVERVEKPTDNKTSRCSALGTSDLFGDAKEAFLLRGDGDVHEKSTMFGLGYKRQVEPQPAVHFEGHHRAFGFDEIGEAVGTVAGERLLVSPARSSQEFSACIAELAEDAAQGALMAAQEVLEAKVRKAAGKGKRARG